MIDPADKPHELIKSTRLQAEMFRQERGRAEQLVREARHKAGQKQGLLAIVWGDLQTLLRLLSAWLHGDYPGIPWQTLALAFAGVLYFVNPFDLVPDFLASAGLLDDAAVIAYVASLLRSELTVFREWEELLRKQARIGVSEKVQL